MNRAFFLLFFPLLLSAQLQLFLAPQGGEEQLLTTVHDMGSVSVADSASVRFRLRNTGQAAVTLSRLTIAGAGFFLTGAPSLPHIVAPTTNVDFTVWFSPPNYGVYSANLQVNNTGYVVRGSGLAGAAVRVNGESLVTGASIDFGRVENGASSSVTVEVANTTTEAVTISALSVSGGAFSIPQPASLPFTLRSGEMRSFGIRYAPASAGIATGTLTVDRRSFRLTGSGFEPNMPRPSIVIETPSIRSGEQGRVSIQLASTSRANAKGQLRMELRPNGQIRDNDAAAQFVNGSRTVAFDVVPGDTVVKLRGENSIVFQSGTTAGTVVFVVEAGGFTEQASVTIAPEAVRIDRATATRSASAIEVQVSGFDNTRSVNDLSFTFYSSTGQPLSSGPVRVASAANFASWWSGSTLGGIFQLKAVFPVTGDISKLGGVEVQMTSSGGTSSTQRLGF